MFRRHPVRLRPVVTLDFLPGKAIDVEIDPLKNREKKKVVENLIELVNNIDTEGEKWKRWEATDSIVTRLRAQGEEMTTLGNEVFAGVSDLETHSDSRQPSEVPVHHDTTELSYKPHYIAGTSTGRILDSVFNTLAGKKRTNKGLSCRYTPSPIWKHKTTKNDIKKTPIYSRLPMWMHSKPNTKTWFFVERVYTDKVLAACAELKTWINKGSYRRKLRKQRVQTQRRKLKETEPLFKSWEFTTERPTDHDMNLQTSTPMQILQNAENEGRRLQDGALSALLGRCDGVRRATTLSETQKIYDRMCEKHSPAEKTHVTAIAILARNHRPQKALQLLLHLNKQGVLPFSCYAFTPILNYGGRLSLHWLVEDVKNVMVREKIQIDHLAWYYIIRSSGEAHGFPAAVRAYRESLKIETGKKVLHNKIFVYLLEKGVPLSGYAVWSEMRRLKVTPGHEHLEAWIKVCTLHGDLDTAVSAMSLAAEDGLTGWSQLASVAVAAGEPGFVCTHVLPLHACTAGDIPRKLLYDILDAVTEPPPLLLNYSLPPPSSGYACMGLLPPCSSTLGECTS
eukprot:TRINITY_DN22071_c0_g1_i1.p1 TRINITY_DN22071_c0_g1~~TRINITY_DN22071_c0_g1_i1.p1  ORF type:complete len:565 (+),score=55.45 TRINITY_DN22071_c0_g1_i1:6-1700(+)